MCRTKEIMLVWAMLLIVAALPVRVCAQTACTNKLLTELVDRLSTSYNLQSPGGETLIPELSKNKPVIIQKDSQGKISHVGIKLFDRNLLHRYPTFIYHFIERYFLELLLLPSEQEIYTKLRMERVKISSEIYKLHSFKKDLQKIISDYSTDYSFYIICNNNRYTVSCMIDDRVLVEVDFPVRYELISGFTKLEAENSVYLSLMSHKIDEYVPLTENELFAYKDSLFCANEDYYLAEPIISTSFYKKEGQAILPVFSPTMEFESVHNLFNASYDWGVEAEITQSLYGGKTISYTLPLISLLDFCDKQHCRLYSGIQKYDKSEIVGALMAVNMELGYQHLMQFSFKKDLLGHPEKSTVKIKMYSYIPIHNVSSLFDEKRTKRK